MEFFLKFLGILLGVLARTLFPFLRKLKEGKVTEFKEFKKGYAVSAAASLVLGVITTLLIFPEFNVAQPGAGAEEAVKLFCVAFGFGFGFNSLIAEGAKWAQRRKKES